jgi:ubiquinol-cytochrome c reductase cytochrome b subunit
VLFLIPFNYTGYIRNTTYRPIFKIFYWILVGDFLALLWLGQSPITDRNMALGQLFAIYYFLFFIFLVPISGIIEHKLARTNTN